ncbi:hypothetical protein OsJ_09926 [Oryza sativa Japonica Group]|uniref:Uncharacterized protein n=1 Tax=Oryza sativa subsp. japonica TaxID=39947 RepID=B9F678_ORYSJ|nr:hypothetical protein OsJ_09926 [Oryza sativa Japonica Group]
MSARRAAAKCQHEPATPPAPRILNMPRRPAGGGRPTRSAGRAQQQQRMAAPGAVNLGALFEMDRRASSLRRRLEKMPPADAEPCVKDIREIALPVAPQSPPPPAEHSDVDDDHSNSPNLSDVSPMLPMNTYTARGDAASNGVSVLINQ